MSELSASGDFKNVLYFANALEGIYDWERADSNGL